MITFSRRCISDQDFPEWQSCQSKFDSIKINISNTEIEKNDGMLQAIFANGTLGGGVLAKGSFQEELRFMRECELLAVRLFTPSLKENECVVVKGIQQYNEIKGYGSTFEWCDLCNDTTPMDGSGRRQKTVVFFDAKQFTKSNADIQFESEHIVRELRKAYTAFFNELPTPPPAVSTGKWGCGYFNGNAQLKSIIQLMAAVVAERSLVFSTCGDANFGASFYMMYEYICEHKITIAELFKILQRYTTEANGSELFDFIIDKHSEQR